MKGRSLATGVLLTSLVLNVVGEPPTGWVKLWSESFENALDGEDWQEARNLLDQRSQMPEVLQPGELDALENRLLIRRGHAAFREGRFEAAARDYERFFDQRQRMDENLATVHRFLESLHRIGEKERLRRYLERLKRVFPEDAHIRWYMAWLGIEEPSSSATVDLTIGHSIEPESFELQSSAPQQMKLIHFWASWCGPCRQEIPSLKKFLREFFPDLKDRGLSFSTVSNDLRESDKQRFLEHYGLTWQVRFDPEQRVNESLAVPSIPATVLIDAEGRVVRRWGTLDWQDETLIHALWLALFPVAEPAGDSREY